jgi:hypothetical protein
VTACITFNHRELHSTALLPTHLGCFDSLDHEKRRKQGRLTNDSHPECGTGTQQQARDHGIPVLSPEIVYGLRSDSQKCLRKKLELSYLLYCDTIYLS